MRGNSIPDGGPPVTERQGAVDKMLIQNDGAQVHSFNIDFCAFEVRHMCADLSLPSQLLQNLLKKPLVDIVQLLQEKAILGTEVAFPDAMRFKGAAPEVCMTYCHAPPSIMSNFHMPLKLLLLFFVF